MQIHTHKDTHRTIKMFTKMLIMATSPWSNLNFFPSLSSWYFSVLFKLFTISMYNFNEIIILKDNFVRGFRVI